jgi:hypothetical protein
MAREERTADLIFKSVGLLAERRLSRKVPRLPDSNLLPVSGDKLSQSNWATAYALTGKRTEP